MSDGGIYNLSGMDYNIAGSGYRCVLLSGNAVELEGIRSVAFFGGESADFNLARGRLKIVGENLRLTVLSRGYACVCGKIDSITVERRP